MLLFQNKKTRVEILKPAFLLLNFLFLNVSIIIDSAISLSFILMKNVLLIKILVQSLINIMLAQQP